MKSQLNEGLDYLDLADQVLPEVTIDKYVAQMGDDDDIVTIAFIVKGMQASKDLSEWFERGYKYVLDSEVSTGELGSGKQVVFVEMERCVAVPRRIIELLSDLQTLTDIKLSDWTIIIDGESYDPDIDILKKKIITSPYLYRQEKESDLNEMRVISGLPTKRIHDETDPLLRSFLEKAGL